MDWSFAIEKHRDALRRALALIAAMAGFAVRPEPDVRAEGEPQKTLPRRLHRAILRLVRPAEAAARRLIVVAARGIVLSPLPPRVEKPAPEYLPRGSTATGLVSTGITIHKLGLANLAPPPKRKRNPFRPLPLVEPLRGLPRRRTGRSVPQIGLGARTIFASPPPSPRDRLDATRISLRISAIAAVLDDLPRHALRLARWRRRSKAIRARGKIHRLGPLRPGRPPGWQRRPDHPVHDVLGDLQGLAVWAQEAPDTS